jgi:hypothetical protein
MIFVATKKVGQQMFDPLLFIGTGMDKYQDSGSGINTRIRNTGKKGTVSRKVIK